MTLFNADVRDVLPSLPDQFADCIFVDPPYRVISGGNKTENRPVGILDANDGRMFKHNDIEFGEYMSDLFRLLRDPGHMYLMVNFLNLEQAFRSIRHAGFNIHNLLVWEKNNATPNRWYMKNCEYIIMARRGKAFPINNKGAKTVTHFTNPSGNRDHPTQKPVDMVRHYIENSTQIGDIVFDPFCGAGSTGVACMESGRRFVGIEIDPEYYNIARMRLSQCQH